MDKQKWDDFCPFRGRARPKIHVLFQSPAYTVGFFILAKSISSGVRILTQVNISAGMDIIFNEALEARFSRMIDFVLQV